MKSKIACKSLPSVVSFAATTVLLACSSLYAGNGNWNVDASGYWSTDSNWSPATAPGTAAGDIVSLATNITAARTITIDTTSRTVGTLIIGDPVSPFNNYTLDATGVAGLTFNNNGSGAKLVQTNNTAAADTVSAPVILADNLNVTNKATLTLSGVISGAGKGITKTGTGTLVLSGANTYGGGTSINDGALQLGANDALPVAGAVVLGVSNTVGNLSLGTFSQRIASLTAQGTSASLNAAVTVASGQTLTINGSGGLFVGIDSGANSTTKVTMSGGGALVVTNASAYVTVGKNQANQNFSNSSTLDLSGLSSVTLGNSVMPVSEIRVSYGQTCPGTLTLSNTSNLLVATALYVGNSLFYNAGNGLLILGAGANVVSADTIGIGIVKSPATMKFASQTAGSAGSVTIGGRTRGTADLVIGSKNAQGSSAVPTGTLDLRGHSANVAAGTVTLGREDNVAASGYTGGAAGFLLFDSGVFTATNLVMGYKVGINTGALAKAIGSLTVGGGVFTVTGGPILLAYQAGAGSASATNNILGGVFRSYADILTGASNCVGVLNLDGGTLDMTGHAIGVGAQTVTVFNARSGTLMNLGEFNGGATVVKSGSGTLTLAGTNTYSGATAISAGTLVLGEGFQLNGGYAAGDIANGAALVYSNSLSQTLSGVISGSGALTKAGSGSLTLAVTNTYAGATAVSAGVLFGTSGGALVNSDVSVSSGATVGVKVLAANGRWECKSLTLGSGVTTVRFVFSGMTPSTTTPPLSVTGDLVNNGTLNVSVSGVNVAVGTYPLIGYAGSLTAGTLGTVSLPGGGTGTLVNNTGAKTIDLSVSTAGSALVWNGGSGDWDIGATVNWTGGRTTYLENDFVRFDDTSSGSAPFTVNLTADLNPGAVVVDNTTANYTFGGPGSLGGEGSLTKRGAGSLTLSTGNTYCGGTTLESNSGTVNAMMDATQSGLGAGPVAVGSGSTLSLGNSNVSAAAVSKANVITGTGVLKLNFAAGPAARSTVLSGLSGFSGTVQLSSAGATGDKWDASAVNAPGATVQVGSGNTLLLGGTTTSLGSISVQGSGNTEGRGALRMGAGTAICSAPIALLGDTTIASDAASATLSGAIVGTAATGGTNVLTQGTASSSAGCVLGGAISDGVNGGRVALTQSKGTLTLSAANSYSGGTTVNGGSTLQLGASGALPVSGTVTLGGTNGVGSLSLPSVSQTIAGLQVISTNAAIDVITAGAGQALIVNGSSGLFVGTDVGGNSTTQLKMTGGGGFVLTNAAANVTVGRSQSDEVGANTCSLDFSELGSLVLGSAAVPINEVRIAYGQYCPGSVRLSDTSNLITAKTLNIGNSNGVVPGGPGTLTLGGGINLLAVDKINIGQSKGSGAMSFVSQAAGSPGTVTIGGKTGSVADLSIGDKTGTWTSATPMGTLDLRGHVATVVAGTVTLGKEDHTGIKESGATGYLYFDTGTFTATNLVMGLKTGFNTGVWARATGTLTVSGGVFTVINSNAFTFASQSGAGYANATLNLNGGIFRTYSDILTGASNCTSIINLDGGTLDMTGCAIGLNAQTVTVFNARSGTLMNLGQFNNGAPLVKTGTGTLSIAGTHTYAGATVVSNGTLRLTSTVCLPATTDLYLVTGATAHLDYVGNLPIHALYINGIRKPGSLYGQNNLATYLTGTGFLEMPSQGTLLRLQ
jgi:autotransporter-associated beta strand protein